MRRKLGALTALVCMIAAGAADAAGPVSGGPNTYTGAMTVVGAAGSTTRPAAAAWTESYGMGSTTQGNVGAPLVDIKTRIYGLKVANARYFPTCTATRINQNNGNSGRWNTVCPQASLVATGSVTAALTSPSVSLVGPGLACNLALWVYNGGPRRLTFFFTTSPSQCAGLQTGAAAAWTGSASQSGKYLVTDTQEPPDVSYNAGNVGLFGSLVSETLKFRKMTVRRHRKVYPFIESIGCVKHARPFSIQYTATTSNTPSAANESSATVLGSANC